MLAALCAVGLLAPFAGCGSGRHQSAAGMTNGGSSCFVGGPYCGGDKVKGDKNTLYRCTGSGAPAKIRPCADGCAVHAGTDDSCK